MFLKSTTLAATAALAMLASTSLISAPAHAQAEGIGETIAVIGAVLILGSESYYKATGKTLSDAVCGWPLGSANAGCKNGKAIPGVNSVGYTAPSVICTKDPKRGWQCPR